MYPETQMLILGISIWVSGYIVRCSFPTGKPPEGHICHYLGPGELDFGIELARVRFEMEDGNLSWFCKFSFLISSQDERATIISQPAAGKPP
jgi:hypothetical protein